MKILLTWWLISTGKFDLCDTKLSIEEIALDVGYESELIEILYAPVDGKIFFIHNAPLTYANTAVIKIVR